VPANNKLKLTAPSVTHVFTVSTFSPANLSVSGRIFWLHPSALTHNVVHYNQGYGRSLRRMKVIKSFYDKGAEDIFNRKKTKEARQVCPENIWRVAQRKLDQLNAVISLNSLRIPPGNEFEALKRERHGQHSIRINRQYRVCFVWTDEGPERVEITDYH
jgi:proteic killer suppression protein